MSSFTIDGIDAQKEMTMTKSTGLATPDEVAAYLALPTRTLGQWRYLGIGPKSIKVGRHCRYRWVDIERWLNDQPTTGPEAA